MRGAPRVSPVVISPRLHRGPTGNALPGDEEGMRGTEGSCSIWALPAAGLRGGAALALSLECKAIREAPAVEGHSLGLVPEQEGTSAEAVGEDAHRAVGVGFAQFFGHFQAPAFGVPRGISHALSPQLFSSSRAFWDKQISRQAGFFRLDVV